MSHRSEESRNEDLQSLWPCANALLPLLPTNIDPDQSFCIGVPVSWPLLQETSVQLDTDMRRRADGLTRQPQLGHHIPERSRTCPRTPSQRARTTPGRQTPIRPKPTCLIGLETSDYTERWTKPTARCTHGPVICIPCFREYIVHKVTVEGPAVLICPDPRCRRVLEHGDVVNGVEGNTACLNRYESLIAQIDRKKRPNFIWCPSCGRRQIRKEDTAAAVVTCEGCHRRSWFRHQAPCHSGLTCEQDTVAAKHQQDNQASEEYIAKHAKRCPNPSCRRPILKHDGCDHMTCRRPGGCGHEFCWTCLADYGPIREVGNHRHGPNCPYYSGPRRRGQVSTLHNSRPPIDYRSVRAVANRARFPAPARPPPTTLALNDATTLDPVPLPITPPPLAFTPELRSSQPPAQPNVRASPSCHPTAAPVPISLVNVPEIPGPGPVTLPAPPLIAARSSGRRMRPPLHSVREKVSLFGKMQDIPLAISSVTWWSLSYLSLVFVALILRSGATRAPA